MSLGDRFADDISLEYSLVDRMRVRGHVMNLQSITMLRLFFQHIRGVEWIEKKDLQQTTADFVRHVEAFAEQNNIPIWQIVPEKAMWTRRRSSWRSTTRRSFVAR